MDNDITARNHRGSPTSIQAHATTPESARQTFRNLILGHIKYYGSYGVTCDELEVALSLTHQSASARVSELIRDVLVMDSGRRRKTRSGKNARVLVIA